MEIGSAGQNIVRDSGSWKDVGKGVALAGKMAAGGVAGMFIDGIGMPVVWTKEVGRSIGRDLLNMVAGKDVPKSLGKLFADTIELPFGVAVFTVIGAYAGLVGGAGNTYDEGLKDSLSMCVEFVGAQNETLKEINDDRDFFISVLG